jgi:hypothetical protein
MENLLTVEVLSVVFVIATAILLAKFVTFIVITTLKDADNLLNKIRIAIRRYLRVRRKNKGLR